MWQFSIKKLEQFSGIKAHTIRAWEKRYALFSPERKGQIRSYNLADVRKLLNISILISHGFRISSLCGLQQSVIESKISSLSSGEALQSAIIRDMISFAYSGDIISFESSLDKTVRALSIDRAIKHIIIPFLERIELLSYSDTSSEAHFMVTAIRRKLIMGIELVQSAGTTGESALLFLPEGEHYDLILLYLNYIIKEQGGRIYYLGTNISASNFEAVLMNKKPDRIYTYLTEACKTDIRPYKRIAKLLAPKARFSVLSEADPEVSVNGLPWLVTKHTLK